MKNEKILECEKEINCLNTKMLYFAYACLFLVVGVAYVYISATVDYDFDLATTTLGILVIIAVVFIVFCAKSLRKITTYKEMIKILETE